MGFYILAGVTDDMRKHYHQMTELIEYAENEPSIHETLRQGINAVLVGGFKHAHNKIQIDVLESRRRLDTVSATIPALWDLNFEQIYGDRISAAFHKVFGYPVKKIIFHTESQIALHYIFYPGDVRMRTELELIDPAMHDLKTQTNALLVIDIGDHSVVKSPSPASFPFLSSYDRD